MSSLLGRRRFLFEADDDGAEAQGGEANGAGTDNTQSDGQSDSNTDDSGDAGGSNSENDDQSGGENQDQDQGAGDDEDLTLDDGDEDTGDDAGGEEDSSDSSSDSGDSGEEEAEVQPEDKGIFDTLSPEEQEIKIKTLRQMFADLYSGCESTIDKYNQVSSECDDTYTQIQHIMTVLFSVKQMISDYLMTQFDKKSYIENDIMLNRFMAMINGVKNVTIELRKCYNSDDTKG